MAHVLYGVKRNSDIGLDYGTDGLELSFTETYRVRADSKTAEQWEVMRDATATDPAVIALLGTNGGVQSTGLPLPGYTISRDGICRCRNLSGQRPENNPLEWEFSATWSSKVQDGRGGASQDGDPTVPLEEIIPIRETMYDSLTRVANVDFQGRMYQNGASTPFDTGLSADEELPRWDFAQFDRNYEGSVSSFSTTYVGMTGEYSVLTEPDYTNSLQPWVWAPGVYRLINNVRVFWAPTDQTVFFLNGCINMVPWLGYPAFTLLLRVRSSKVGYYNGARKRLTEFSVIYDRKNWHDKALNAGPQFLAPELDANGNDVVPTKLISYPYIYYSKAEEDGSEDLAIDQRGLLGEDPPITFPTGYSLFLLFTGNAANPTPAWRTESFFFVLPNTFGHPYAGAVKVTTVDKKKTYRANKPTGLITPNFIEYQNRDLVNFAYYLRPTLVGPYIA